MPYFTVDVVIKNANLSYSRNHSQYNLGISKGVGKGSPAEAKAHSKKTGVM